MSVWIRKSIRLYYMLFTTGIFVDTQFSTLFCDLSVSKNLLLIKYMHNLVLYDVIPVHSDAFTSKYIGYFRLMSILCAI